MNKGLTSDLLKANFKEFDLVKAAKLPEGSKRKFGPNWYIKQGGKWVYLPSSEHKEHKVGKHLHGGLQNIVENETKKLLDEQLVLLPDGFNMLAENIAKKVGFSDYRKLEAAISEFTGGKRLYPNNPGGLADHLKKVMDGGENVGMEQFKKLALSADNADDFFTAVRKIKGVPPDVSAAFHEKYAQGGKVSMQEAAAAYYNEVRGKKKKAAKTTKKAAPKGLVIQDLWKKHDSTVGKEVDGQRYIHAGFDSIGEGGVWYKEVDRQGVNGYYKEVKDPNAKKIAKKVAAIDKLTVKDIKGVEVEVESVDEWVGVSIEIKGNWEAFEGEDWNDPNSTKLREKLINLTLEHPDYKKQITKIKGRSVSAEDFEDGPRVQKRVPIPTHHRDFDDFEFHDGSAWFSNSER